MEARPGNSKTAEAVAKPLAPKDRRYPLARVEFTRPVSVPEFGIALRIFEKGLHPDRDSTTECPKLFFDSEFQTVIVGTRHFPVHLVSSFDRAKAA